MTVGLDRGRLDLAARRLGAMAVRDAPLGAITTYRVGGRAALLARPATVDDLLEVAGVVADTGLPVIVVGRGSNMLVADAGFGGIAVSLSGMGERIETLGGAEPAVRADAAVLLPRLGRRTASLGLVGLEWAVGIPGTVGGAVRMNAGGHGDDVAGRLVSATVVDLATARVRPVAPGELGLRFRGSDLADHQVVVDATFSVAVGDPEAALARIDEIVRWRRENQPGGQNAGSVFVNPVPGVTSAGELVERAGLRGMRLGSAAVSDKHANFIQASEGGTAADVRALIELVRDRVREATGFSLRSEVRLVGFDDVADDPAPGVAV